MTSNNTTLRSSRSRLTCTGYNYQLNILRISQREIIKKKGRVNRKREKEKARKREVSEWKENRKRKERTQKKIMSYIHENKGLPYKRMCIA
jgi:hypothetical protein